MYLAPLSTLPVSHWQNQLSIQAQEVGRQVLAAPSLCISRAVVVQLLSCVQLFAYGLRHSRLPCPSPSPIFIISKSCPLSRRCHPTSSSSVIPFFSCLQFFPASGSFPMSQLFTSSGQSIGDSASASILPMNIQGWFPGFISLLSKGLSRVFSSTTVQKHQFFSTQPSLWSNSHICTWLLGKP